MRRLPGAVRYVKGILALAFMAFWVLTWSYIPRWEYCDFLFAYPIEHDPVPNVKALENGIYAALRTDNLALLSRIAEHMRTNHGEYGIAGQQAADLICFLLGHVALLKQDLPTAFAAYAPLISRVEQTEAAGFLWPKLTLGMLFRDLALISMHEGNPQRAVRFLDMELKVRRKDRLQYYLASAMRAKLLDDRAGEARAWKRIVELAPGKDGMVHISELSWSRIKNPAEVVSVGDHLDVYVLSFDPEKHKISLGVKDRTQNPWDVFMNTYKVGDVANVRIVKLMTFGAFAEVVPGVDGLIHISQIADRRIDKPSDVLAEGDKVDAKIIAIDEDKKKISLSIRALLTPAAEEEAPVEE